METEDIDYAVAAWREEGRWTVSSLPARTATSLESLSAALRQLPGEGGVFGIVVVANDFFFIVRQRGDQAHVLFSDGLAALDYELADEAAEEMDVIIDEDELDDFMPVGDLAILADFGVGPTDVQLLCEDEQLFPDDQVKAIAKQAGFGRELAGSLARR